ncbi:TerB family tellurite resistance protein [Hymenobacter cheonanensis]|uniref:TerB family tellurite resistance protein n=1 Tax=Hymenobacter sp. CA2-7 TaxID=3063993 RepID=UPI00271388E2|nr:TerB family tellurite resistance protein [Hymenobacter sp. CA2-7]MDO7884560.1 TerB family tellurite resistance protein [Hymenobacter sp. CA2-7]
METQLLQNYSEAEKTAYLSAIAALATADRQASAPEAEFLQRLAQQAGLSDAATRQVLAAADSADNSTVQQSLDQLKSSDLRYSLVTDLISLARADGTYSAGEEEMVGKMAAYLGINPEQKQTLESVVDQAASVPHDPQDPGKQGFLSSIGDKLSNVGIPKGALMAGLLGVVAPMVISRVMGGGNSNSNSGYGQPQSQSGSLGGLLSGAMGSMGGGSGLGGLLGGLLGGGLLSGVLGGGGQQQQTVDTSQYPQQGSMGGSGLGSIMSVLGGLGGRPNSQPASAGGGGIMGSGLGGLLGGLFGGR